MKRSLLVIALLLLAGGVVLSQGIHHSTTDTYDFVNGLQFNGGTRITGGPGAQDDALNLPVNSVGGAELSGMVMHAVFCGEAVEAGVAFLGPSLTTLRGANDDTTIGGTVCDALESVTEATADAPLFGQVPFHVLGMYCHVDGTFTGTQTAVFTLRAAGADTTPVVSCTVGAGQTDCRTLTGTTTDVAPGAPVAVQMTQTSDHDDGENGRCVVALALQ